MIRRSGWMVAALAAATILGSGCKNADEELEPAVVPKSVSFEGQVDGKYAGAWKSSDGNSVIDLVKDGTMTIDTSTNSVQGKSTTHLKGAWLASDGAVLFKYADSTGGDTTVKYVAKLEKDTLVLGQSGGKIKTTYHRK